MILPKKPNAREAAKIRRQDFDRELLARCVAAVERVATALEVLVAKRI